jgi:hypothetical protein
MSDEWGPWMLHWPGAMPVPAKTVIIAEMGFACSGDYLGPMCAEEFDWFCPGDPVARYRIQNPPKDHADAGGAVDLPERVDA